MNQSFTILRVRGIRIGANWSWLFVFAFIIWTLASAEFPRTYPGLSKTSYIAMGVVAGVLFVISLLLHELGHAFTAIHEGMEIEGITLWLFGGVARFKGMFKSAGSEFRIAIAGPIVSAVICGVFALITAVLNHIAVPAQVVGVTHYIALINGILLGFNMIPALPLDGGRVFRAYLWHRQGDFTSATMSAARTARVLAGALIAFGVLTFIQGADIGGLWFSFIGWFLLQAAQGEANFARVRSSLSGLRVRDVMTSDPVVVTPDRSVSSFIDEYAHARGHSAFPVASGSGLGGLVSLRNAGAVPHDRRASTTVGDVMTPPDKVPVVSPEDEVFDVLPRLQDAPGRAVVVDDGHIVGIVSGSDIARALELEQLRGPGDAAPPGPPPARRRSRATWIVPTVLVLAVAAYVVKPPVAVLSPGASFDVVNDIHITGIATDHVDGKYLLTSVAVDQPNTYGLLAAIFRSREFVPISELIPRGVDPKKFFDEQRREFAQSQMEAAGAAAKAAGLPVTIDGRGAIVTDVVPGAPAARVLTKDDVITAIDGTPVATSGDVAATVRARPAGTLFTVMIVRNSRTITVHVRSRSGLIEGAPAIGIISETKDLSVKLPFKITFRNRAIGGTSAGLAYSLAIYDLIRPGDLARGRSIAATGTIDVDGAVGPIGGAKEKAAAALSAGAKLFLVPNEELSDAQGTGLPTHGVASLQDAIALLMR